ncbi:MAG: TlpA family protein disulfide reductase [Solirubrobacterales bacterium]
MRRHSQIDMLMRICACSAVIVACAAILAGCGASGDDSPDDPIAAAAEVNEAVFPTTDGKKTFGDLQREVRAMQDATLLPAANNFVADRENRLPFGLFDADRKPIWGPTVMYLSAGTDAPASGPYPVTPHDFDVPTEFQSETSKGDLNAVGNGFYTAMIPPAERGDKVNVLTLTETDDGFQAAATGITLAEKDPTVAPGDRVPAIDTPTLDDVDGDARKLSTRVPPADMHEISLKDALKQNKPIVLLFATPKLCASRVCGPIVDVAASVQANTGDDVIFIHNEIYKNNDLNAGNMPQVDAFGLTSEPYTFVIGADGRVVEQLQGPFVADELESALEKAQQ